MFDQITPGSRVRVEVMKNPTNAAARKTLVRLLSKDPVVKAENKRLRSVRQSRHQPKMRGGRLYGGRMIKLRPVKGQVGEGGTLTATADVVSDLRSVVRFVQVTSA